MYGSKTCPFCGDVMDVSELKLFRKYVDHLESHADAHAWTGGPEDDDDGGDDDNASSSTATVEGRPAALNCGFGMYPSRAPGDGAAETNQDARRDPAEDAGPDPAPGSGVWTPTD